VTYNEKLPKINLLRLLSKERVRYNLATVLVNHGTILVGEPASHPLLKLWRLHTIAMSLVTNQLMI
jgi:hypothetical protein